MNRSSSILSLVLVCLVLALSNIAATADHHEGNAAAADHTCLQFMPMAEGSPIQVAVVRGDPSVGPASIMLKFPAGHENPVHAHSSNYTAVVIEGSVVQWGDGDSKEPAKTYQVGDTFGQSAGDYHGDSFSAEGPTVVFVYFDGPVDVIPKEAD